jgi:PleD family two-component response regulator
MDGVADYVEESIKIVEQDFIHRSPEKFIHSFSTFIDNHFKPAAGDGNEARLIYSNILNLGKEIRIEKELMKALNQRGIDSLTGIYNRGKFDDDLKKTVESKREVDEEFSLVMFDIDDFKSVNDKHGHDVGDEVLRYVARVIPKHIKRVRWFL